MAEAQAQVIIRTVADLRAHAITTWLQPITVCIPIPEGDALKVNLESQGSLPVSLYLYELALLMKEATTAGGRKWWFRQVREPDGAARQAKFDVSVLFVCPHFRGNYKKQETTGQRVSQHVSCVKCPAACRFQGCVVTRDPSVAVVITGTLIQPVRDILLTLRTNFDRLKHGKGQILKAGGQIQVVFIFENSCLADDAETTVDGREHRLFKGKLRAECQAKHMWTVYMLQNMHQGHIQPMLPCQKGMLLSYAMTKEVAEMSSAGAPPAAIISFLTKNGQLGMLTAHKVEHIRQTVLSDLDTYTVRPKKSESAAQAMINMLDCRKRRGPKHGKTFAKKKANEGAAPDSMKRARKGTAPNPIHIASSSDGGKDSSSSTDSESEGASSSDAAQYGFHYSSGCSQDSYPSSDT